MSRVALSFANASCAHCVRVVSKALGKVDGVGTIEIDRGDRRVVVDFDPRFVTVDELRTRMEETGYPTRLLAHELIARRAEYARAA